MVGLTVYSKVGGSGQTSVERWEKKTAEKMVLMMVAQKVHRSVTTKADYLAAEWVVYLVMLSVDQSDQR